MALEPTLARFATLARFVTAAGAADMVIVSLGWFAALYLSGVAGVAWATFYKPNWPVEPV